MPIYQYWCDHCFLPLEITMSLADKERYDNGKLTKKEKKNFKCPECKRKLEYLIAPPKTIKIN